MEQTTIVQTKKVTTVQLNKNDLIEILRDKQIIPRTLGSADIYMHVPGGGDWSHTNLHVDEKDTPLIITFEQVETRTVK